MAEWLNIEVAAALADRQVLVSLTLAEGSSVQDAIDAAEVASRLPGFAYDKARVGVFGRLCRLDRLLADGDRVELYRPLKADPKEVRRQLAELERGGKSTR